MKKNNSIAPKIPAHIVDNELLQAHNPVMVNLIGAGGTGSHVLTALSRLNFMLNELDHPGIFVRVFDDDIVEPNNRLRMLFTTNEIGLHKSVVLVNRNNRFFGTNWKAYTERFDLQTIKENPELAMAAITISCVDSVDARFEIADMLKAIAQEAGHRRNKPKYWLDFGNNQFSGQAIISTVGEIIQPESERFDTKCALPMVTDEFADLLRLSEKKDKGHSCSVSGALLEQDLFINTPLAYIGVELLKRMFREGMLFERGFFFNLKDFRTHPLKVA